jgi:thiol:disulfide interchange protein DsbA
VHRRTLVRRIFLCLACFLLLASGGGSIHAQSTEGREYIVLEPRRSPPGAAGIEVIEFFYYGCPICYEAQPHIARWLSGAGPDVVFRRIPAAASAPEESFARTYYALESAGHLARLHWPVYDNHHFDGLMLHEEANLLSWLARNNVDAEQFRAVRNSADNRAMVANARRLFNEYDVKGVPTFAVDGRYVTSARRSGGVREMLKAVEFLVDRARKERAAELPRPAAK